jgi:predicted RNA-binding protein (TIGR00451 family)
MQQVDKGAIRFVLSGANIMCPGLTSKGAKMMTVEKGTVVVSFKYNMNLIEIVIYFHSMYFIL